MRGVCDRCAHATAEYSVSKSATPLFIILVDTAVLEEVPIVAGNRKYRNRSGIARVAAIIS